MGHEVEIIENLRHIERELAILNDIMKKIANILLMLVEVEEIKIVGEEEESGGEEPCH